MAQILKAVDKMDDDIQFDNLLKKRNQVKFGLVASKEQALHTVTRQIPVQLLALEWLNKIDASIETRAYLVENFLPMLVLGCEKILKEAQNRNLLQENKKDLNFNPINQLAQYLMRNNPKYNSNNETSAYVRTMREVYQELREQMFAFQENKLAKVKADVRKRRSERERIEKTRELESERRKLKLEDIFSSFRVAPSGRIEIAIVLETIQIYNEYVSRMPDSLRNSLQLKQNAWPSFCFDRSNLNVAKRLLKHEYASVMNAFTENMTSEYFDLFIEFIEQSSLYYVQLANRVTLNRLLVKLFHLMDTTKTGFLTRRRLMPIFEAFQREEINSRASQLRNAMEWPLLDPFVKFENKLEEIKTSPDLIVEDTRVNTSIDLVLESGINQTTSQTNESQPSDDAKTTDGNETINDEASSIAQDNDKQLERTNTINNDTTTLETTINRTDKSKSDKNAKPKYTYEELFTPMKVKLDKSNELQFLKGGSFYFKPIESLFNSFDVSLLKLNPSYSVVQYDELHEFNTEFVDSKQFLNMINSFLQPSFCFSEIFVNDLILFIKNSYTETLAEKNLKLEKVAEENKNKQIFQKYSACFDRMDNDASGFIDFEHLTQMFESYKDGFFKDYVEKAKAELQPDIMLNNHPDQFINKDEFIKFLTTLINLADLPKLQDQIIHLCMSSAQITYDEKARGESRRKWLEQMKNTGDITFGSLEPLYKQLFLVLLKDSENHGNSKNISAYVSILDKKDREIVLKYQASTPQDSKYLLGKTLTRHIRNVSFKVIDTGKSVHVSRVQQDPNVYLFNPENKNNGSLVLYPLKYTRNKTFGVLGIDTLQDKNKKNYFSDQELNFYQGVATTFGKSYASIVFKNRLGKLISSAVEWLSQRAKKLEFYNAYAVQLLDNETRLVPDEANNTNSTDQSEKKPTKINLKQILKCIMVNNKLEDILQPDDTLESNHKSGSCVYECAVTSESTVEVFNSRSTYCFPLRNEEHKSVFVIEMTTKENVENIQKVDPDYEQIETVIYVLHKCQEELLEESLLGIDKNKYDLENQFEQEKFEILFEKVYIDVIMRRLEKFMDQSLESSDPELIKLISDVIGFSEFYSEQVISKSLLDKLSSFDPTLDTPFKRTESKYKLISQDVLKELHELCLNTNKENLKQKMLVDWCCLIKNMKNKTEKIRANN